jgi:hypothetical protein
MIRFLLCSVLFCVLALPAAAQFVFEDTLLIPSDAAAGDSFGNSLSISADGSRIFVGAPYAERDGQSGRGSVYVFRKDGSTWAEERIFEPPDAGRLNFGLAVALSGDARWAAIGTHTARLLYFFEREGEQWTLRQRIPGISGPASWDAAAFSADGQRFVLGAARASPNGKVHVFSLSGTQWVQEAVLDPQGSVGVLPDFGMSVAVSPEGDELLVGASYDGEGFTGSGAVYLFRRQGTIWTQVQKIKASDMHQSAQFGRSVALSADGSISVIGSMTHRTYAPTAGAVYVFRLEREVFVEDALLRGKSTDEQDYLGSSVALSADGRTVLGGAAHAEGTAGAPTGLVHVFRREGNEWVEMAPLAAGDGQQGDQFGVFVALSESGQAAVSANRRPMPGVGQNVGAVYTYDLSGITVSSEPPPAQHAPRLAVYPNPALGRATVALNLAHPEAVRLVVYDVLGREVRRLAEGTFASRSVDVEGLAPGMYLVVAEGDGWRQSARLVVAR